MVSVGGIVSVGGGTSSGGGGNASGLISINSQIGPDITLNGVSGVTILTVAPNTINIGVSGLVAGSGIKIDQVSGNYVLSVSGISSSSSSVTKFAQSFTNIISGQFVHGLNSLDVIVQVRDNASGGGKILIPDEIIIESADFISILFNSFQSGRVVII